jgi:hypothetical protein
MNKILGLICARRKETCMIDKIYNAIVDKQEFGLTISRDFTKHI